jgi:hypothetical protein
VERVQENAADFKVPRRNESNGSRCFALLRIQGQGEAEELMRSKEDENWRCSMEQ